jgi:3-hydroxy-9,10-secoandrosta-1,3,5(10)-triene-9,17-dione monooxygenase
MSVATRVAEGGFPPPPEPNLTPADVIARAEAIAPTLVARQAETELRTYYAEDTHEEFRKAGLYRILVPRRYGGYEFGIETFMRVLMTLARHCPSTGWMYCFGAAHALAAATLFGEEAQAELFSGGDFICPATVAPSGIAERSPDGGWVINGTWNYCSGAPYATHMMAHTLVFGDGGPPSVLMFIAPRSEWTLLEDWGNQLGLKGSGSHSITIENGHIPDYFALESTHLSQVDVTGGTPGRQLHNNPEFGGGPLSFMLMEIAALSVAIAQGALDTYEELMRARTTAFTPVVGRFQDPDYQFWYGEASGTIATAEAAMMNAVHQWTALCEQGAQAFTREQELRLATICRGVARLSWQAMDGTIFPTAGSSAVRSGERLERVWRDMSMVHSHAGIAIFLSTMANRELAKARLDSNAEAAFAAGL